MLEKSALRLPLRSLFQHRVKPAPAIVDLVFGVFFLCGLFENTSNEQSVT
jgi:hypothetical protein